jgi:hypothetical protein
MTRAERRAALESRPASLGDRPTLSDEGLS